MKLFIWIASAVVAALLLGPCGKLAPARAHPPSYHMRIYVVAVTDGDTFKAVGSWFPGDTHPIDVRLLGIAAPEIGRARCERERVLGKQAKKYLADLLAQPGELWLVEIPTAGRHGHEGHDELGRVLGRVTLPTGVDLGDQLCAAGLAKRWKPGDPPIDWCRGDPA